jgi:proline dehydrogenase
MPPALALLDRALVRLLPAVPKPVVQRLSSRYIAGPHLDDALRVVRQLNAAGKAATIDVLGEEISSGDEARAIAGQYHDVLAELDAAGLDAGVSVKLTGLGLELDYELCRDNLESVVRDAAARGRFVRIDMEDSSTTERTLQLYRLLRGEGHANVGVVLQAYMRRTLEDIAGLDDVRLCKGIYVEPHSIAYRDFDEVRANYVRALELLVEQGSRIGIATHDEYLLQQAERIVRERGLAADRYEFQMLLGVRPERGDELVAAGHPLRVYVPFGTHWYEYSLRRLQENPKIAGYVARDTFGRLRNRPAASIDQNLSFQVPRASRTRVASSLQALRATRRLPSPGRASGGSTQYDTF